MSSRPRLLIVDDYADALDVWEVYLRTEGFDVLTAADGQTAFSHAVREKPDLIVMDLELPDKSGFEVARDLKARPDTCTIPLIAATGYSHAKQLDLARTSVAEIRRLLRRPESPLRSASEQEPSIVR